MSLFSAGFDTRNKLSDISLSEHTTMRVGGPARLVELECIDDLPELVEQPLRWLGKGANLLVGPEGVAGFVARLGSSFNTVEIRDQAGDMARVQVGGAYDLARLVGLCAREGLAGPEGLAGVPASMGGALRMNAGTTTCWTFDWVSRVQVYQPDTGVRWLERPLVPAVYRDAGLGPDTVYLACELELRRGDPEHLKAEASRLKQKKAASQPLAARSAGCMFKNPSPELPAGRLIEELGLKGARVGEATVSRRHANFIINEGQASAADVCELIRQIRAKAWQERGVVLDLEVQTWNCPEDIHQRLDTADTAKEQIQ